MNRPGANVFKGINSQALAAMSLLLQYVLREPQASRNEARFSYIHFEAPKFADFNLVFDDGRKIICEVKNWKNNFSYANLKEVLDSIKGPIGEKDEILIIYTNGADNFRKTIENAKYFEKIQEELINKHGFVKKHIALLSRVRFWKIDRKREVNKKIARSLFTDLLGSLCTEQQLNEIITSFLVEKIYEGSEKGTRYSRIQLIEEIANRKKLFIKDSGVIDEERKKLEDILKAIKKACKDPSSYMWANNQISSLSAQPRLMIFLLNLISNYKKLKLGQWEHIWKAYQIYPFHIFRILRNNLQTEENRKYIIGFFKSIIQDFQWFYSRELFEIEIIEILEQVLREEQKYINDAFVIIKAVIEQRRNDIFYKRDTELGELYYKDQIGKLLKKIYTTGEIELRNQIYELITNHFNLIKDVGDFNYYTPSVIFEIVKDWLADDVKNKFNRFIEAIITQYNEEYKHQFNGWDYFGGLTSFAGDKYAVLDHHFVIYILRPVFNNFYSKDKDNAWYFIKTNCVSKTKEVSAKKPDFLNRSVLPIVLERYKEEKKVSSQAFEILEEFITSTKGIPHKRDLIYQSIINDDSLSSNRKWKLAKVGTDEWAYECSDLIEELLTQLILKNNKQAKEKYGEWYKDEKYFEHFRFGTPVTQIRKISVKDLEYAIELFELFIKSNYFINKQDSFKANEAAFFIYDILKKDFKKGLAIIRSLETEKKITKNQQILLTWSLFDYKGNDSDDVKFLEQVYKKITDPLLKSLKYENREILKKIPCGEAREAIVKFASCLARQKKVKEALRIVEAFINDPNPYLPDENDPDDPKKENNEHAKIERGDQTVFITSVRGWCAQTLMYCAGLAGRKHIFKIIDLTERLIKDENLYVKHMACFPLGLLTANRLTVMPDNKDKLFFGDNTKKALKRAEKVESLAFELLKDIDENTNAKVKEALGSSIVKVFDRINNLNQEKARKLLLTLARFPSETITEASKLFIHYAEFRKISFKNWKWSMPNLYDNLAPDKFNDGIFKKLLINVLNKLEPNKRFRFGSHFERLIRKGKPNTSEGEQWFKIAYKYLNLLSKDYNNEIYNIIKIAIKEGMEKKWHFEKWYELYKKCLKMEKKYHLRNDSKKNTEYIYGLSLQDRYILEIIYETLGLEKSLDVLEIIKTFPDKLILRCSEDIFNLLNNIAKTKNKKINNRVKNIIKHQFKKYPDRYYDLNKKWN